MLSPNHLIRGEYRKHAAKMKEVSTTTNSKWNPSRIVENLSILDITRFLNPPLAIIGNLINKIIVICN